MVSFVEYVVKINAADGSYNIGDAATTDAVSMKLNVTGLLLLFLLLILMNTLYDIESRRYFSYYSIQHFYVITLYDFEDISQTVLV